MDASFLEVVRRTRILIGDMFGGFFRYACASAQRQRSLGYLCHCTRTHHSP
jgi:hypothetical protein